MKRRSESEQEPGDHRDDGGEGHHRRVQPDLGRAGDAVGIRRDEQLHPGVS